MYNCVYTVHEMCAYLQNSAHPLEAVFLGGVGPLLRHDHDPLIVKHGDGEHRYPEAQTHGVSMLLSLAPYHELRILQPVVHQRRHKTHSNRDHPGNKGSSRLCCRTHTSSTERTLVGWLVLRYSVWCNLLVSHFFCGRGIWFSSTQITVTVSATIQRQCALQQFHCFSLSGHLREHY